MPTSIAPKQVFAPVLANDQIIADHKVLVCEAPALAALARPGHFVNVLTAERTDPLLRKPFSIYTADPVSGQISLLYSIVGPTTQGMARKRPGDLLDLVGRDAVGQAVTRLPLRSDPEIWHGCHLPHLTQRRLHRLQSRIARGTHGTACQMRIYALLRDDIECCVEPLTEQIITEMVSVVWQVVHQSILPGLSGRIARPGWGLIGPGMMTIITG